MLKGLTPLLPTWFHLHGVGDLPNELVMCILDKVLSFSDVSNLRLRVPDACPATRGILVQTRSKRLPRSPSDPPLLHLWKDLGLIVDWGEMILNAAEHGLLDSLE